jgi:hypothetical protein
MSSIDLGSLKSSKDLDIPFSNDSQAIGVTQINHDTLIEFGMLVKTLRIVNDDNVNNITYKTGSASGLLKTLPPNSEVTIDGWFSVFQIFPNAVTGNGLIEMDLTPTREALKDNLK